MAADNTQQQEGSKTLVSFVVGLLIGGMLVWAFSGPGDSADHDDHNDDVAGEEMDMDDDMDESDDEGSDDDGEVEAPAVAGPTAAPAAATDGSIVVADQAAGAQVALTSATYPVNEGWIGVQDYNDGQFGTLLGVVQFSAAAEIAPSSIGLQYPTTAGRQYAIVIYESDGVRGFSSAGDTRIDQVFDTFTAQ